MKKIFVCLLLLPLMSSCGYFQKRAAISLNNRLMKVNDSLFIYGRQLGAAVHNGSITAIKAKRSQLGHYIDTKLVYVAGIPDEYGSQDLRKAEIEFLQYEKKLNNKIGLITDTIHSQSAEHDSRSILLALKQDAGAEGYEIAKLISAQNAYAARNHFKVNTFSDR